MAGDWIKMRTDLYRDPKVCVMADLLMDTESELSRFVNDNKRRDMTVTRNVTRCACVGALLSVWGVLRHRGKRDGDDLVCNGVTLSVIDDISDIPGFGDVMHGVGWAVHGEQGITLPRFFSEYNADPLDAQKSKAAERQARYRQKTVAQQGVTRDVTSDVTRDVTVTDRIEKNREEKKDTAGAVSVVAPQQKPKPSRAFAPPTVEEVRAYCTERSNAVDPERFVDHYAARGWVMSNGRQIKDWQACVRTWEKNDAERRIGSGNANTASVLSAAGIRPGGGTANREQAREAANLSAIAGFLQSAGVRESDGGAHHAQKNLGFHGEAATGVALRSAAFPGGDDQSVGGRTSNVGDAIPGACRPVQALSAEDATGLRPDGG
jgi:hypothetical protein